MDQKATKAMSKLWTIVFGDVVRFTLSLADEGVIGPTYTKFEQAARQLLFG